MVRIVFVAVAVALAALFLKYVLPVIAEAALGGE